MRRFTFAAVASNALELIDKKMKNKIIALLFISCPLFLFAQMDTIVVFDIPSQTMQLVPIHPFDTLIRSDSVPGFIGNWQNQVDLKLTLPDTTPPNSTFSNLELALNDFDLLKYPTRTNVAIVWSDSIYEQTALCSGSLISENVVLTAAHCLGQFNINNEFIWKPDGMNVSPSHSGGFPQPTIGKIRIEKYVILKGFYDNPFEPGNLDIGLIILKEPIGRNIGWLGFGFNNDSLFYTQPIFYNFSYPGREGYDGEDMYYYYGRFKSINLNSGYVGHGGVGIPGMSGGNFFFSNNEINISYGEHVYPGVYKLITRENYFAIKQIVEMFEVGISEEVTNNNDILIYPNPMIENATIEVLNPNLLKVRLTFALFNSFGIECIKRVNIQQSKTLLKRENLKPGLYIFKLLDETEILATGKLIVPYSN